LKIELAASTAASTVRSLLICGKCPDHSKITSCRRHRDGRLIGLSEGLAIMM
jgi:hypothetical protein